MKKTYTRPYGLKTAERRTLKFTHVRDEVPQTSGPGDAESQVLRAGMVQVIWPFMAFAVVALAVMGVAQLGGYDAAFIASRFRL